MHPDSSALGPPDPGLVFDMANAHQRTSALFAAIELDVFRAVGEGPGDVGSIAHHCKASERGIRILCDFLVIGGMLLKQNGHYHHTPTSAAFLDPRSPACMASMVQYMSNPRALDLYAGLSEIVRNGRTRLAGEGTVEPDNPMWVDFAEQMAPMMGALAGPFCAAVLEGASAPSRVLDIAAGHGLFGIEFAKRNPQTRVTGVDWPIVLEVAVRNAHKAGVQDRYELLPGSAFDVEFGGPYDVVLLTNFLHHFDKVTCVNLLKKVRKALRPGGRVATLEFVPDEDRVSPPGPAAFSLIMLATTASGDAYPLSELTAMYKEAGFHDISAHPLPMSPETAVMALA